MVATGKSEMLQRAPLKSGASFYPVAHGFTFTILLRSLYEHQDHGTCGKKLRKTERPMTTALFMLRCVELGLNIGDLDLLTIGSVNDMFNEKRRDSLEWREEASQTDFDRF